MPGQLFTDAERRRLGGFPDRVSHEDLVTYYTLTRSDRAEVNQCAADDADRLGYASTSQIPPKETAPQTARYSPRGPSW